MPTKIETGLTPAEVAELCQKLFGTEGGRKLCVIQAEARKYGVDVSRTGATTFRDNVLDPYIAGLKAKADRARQVAEFAREGLSMADAASVRLSETVFDELMTPGAAGLTAKERDTYSKIIARTRAGDQRAAKLEADLKLRDEQVARLTSEREEREAKLRSQAEALRKTTTQAAASPDEIRAQTVALIDEVMGIKTRTS
ncbi:MAG: hypothetical protein LBK99_00745 [Opitutaceae bacterium]|jgi:hypothetical protein|nr:hypothetical protein [Opitutaceae bacterium]